jgi:hypothetical protein
VRVSFCGCESDGFAGFLGFFLLLYADKVKAPYYYYCHMWLRLKIIKMVFRFFLCGFLVFSHLYVYFQVATAAISQWGSLLVGHILYVLTNHLSFIIFCTTAAAVAEIL